MSAKVVLLRRPKLCVMRPVAGPRHPKRAFRIGGCLDAGLTSDDRAPATCASLIKRVVSSEPIAALTASPP
jgi:hypothetical protein